MASSAAPSDPVLRWPRHGLGMQARLRAFRQVRLASFALVLATAPAMMLAAAESPAVMAALLLAAALPAVIAMDCRRPGLLDRAVLMSFVASAAVLTGGILKGLPPQAAALWLILCVAESALIASRRHRRVLVLLSTAAAVAATVWPLLAPESATAGVAAFALSLAVAALGLAAMVRGLLDHLADRQAPRSPQRLSADDMARAVSDVVLEADQTGVIERISLGADRLLGLPETALLGRGLMDLVLVPDRPAFLSAISKAANGGEPTAIRIRLRASADPAKAIYRWVEARLVASVGARHVLLALRDIEGEVTDELRAQAARDELAAARHAQVAFLSTINHELRTPLNAIIGFSDMLAHEETAPRDPAKVAEYARIIRGAGHDMLLKVSAMIDITRLQSGVYDFAPEWQDGQAVVAATVESFAAEPENTGATVNLQGSPEPVMAPIDGRALRALLQQLLSNAVKFGAEHGPVDVDVTSTPGGSLRITVADRGPGIPSEKLAEIGASFTLGDATLARSKGGLGLGLSLARGLTDLHGGRLTLACPPEGGTRVTVTIPAEPSDQPSTGNVTTLHPKASGLDDPAYSTRKTRRRHG